MLVFTINPFPSAELLVLNILLKMALVAQIKACVKVGRLKASVIDFNRFRGLPFFVANGGLESEPYSCNAVQFFQLIQSGTAFLNDVHVRFNKKNKLGDTMAWLQNLADN